MKKSFSVMVAIVLIASMGVLAFAACVTDDDECRHSAMQCVGAVDATCVENGNIEYWYCIDCGKCFSDSAGENEIAFGDTVIAATGEHDWGEWVTDSESSCTTGGTRHRVCNVCGERQDETLPVGKHDLNFVKAVEATCTEEGNVAHWHCSECGKNYSDEEATEVLNDVTTPKAAHDTTFVEAQAHTCTDDGNIAYWHCGACGHNFADEDGEQELESVVDPAAHTWGEWEQTSDPTCTERGVLTRVCEVCFDEEYDYIDELGHDFEDAEWAYNDANHWHLCNRCGAASQRELHEYDAEGVCVCGMIEYAPTSEFRFISLGGDTWRLANYTGTRRNVSIPSTYNGGTVVAISDNAFAGNTSMETLVIPETVTSIGAEAFADCANLKNLTMSSKVTTIGDNAFDGCDAIETASIPANAASYISKVNLVNLTVTNGAIEEYAFASSPKLVSVEVVGETTSIGREAFSGCAVLASVEVDGQEVAIGDNAFVDCAMLTDVTFGDVASIGDFAFKDGAAIGEVVIPDSVMSIGGGAFSGCSGLTSMRLPFVGGSEQTTPSASTLFGYIFGTESYANSFETVQLYGVEEGQSVAYYIPRNLSTVSVGGDIGFGAFYGCDRLVDVTIEESEDVDAYAFYNNIALSHIGIPTTVTHIGEMAFAYCTALEEIEFPGTIKIVDKYAMSESAWYAAQPDGAVYIDKALYDYKGAFPEELQIKDGTYSVTSEAFLNAYALKSLVFPSSLEIFQDSAFDGCAVTDIVGNMEQISLFPKEAFERVTIIDSTSIPSSAFSGCENLTSVTIPDSVTSIGGGAFSGCSGLTSITIPDSVTSIGYDAFYNCSGLINVTIGEGVKSIGSGAFSDCSGLSNIVIPDSVTSIGERAFDGCNGLTSITIEEGVISIGYRAFYECSGLTSVTIPDSVTSIGYEAFMSCSGLTSITIPFVGADKAGGINAHFGYIFGASSSSYNDDYVPETLKEVIITGGESIGGSAFSDCSGLTSITIPDSLTSIGSRAFDGCSGLTSIVIPDSVTSIGYRAFSGCSGLTSITIPDSVTSIGYGVFSGCSSLTSIVVKEGNNFYRSDGNCLIETTTKTLIAGCKTSVIPIDGSVTKIKEYVFENCSGLTSIVIPDSVTSIGGSAFSGCSGLTSITIPFVGERADGTGETHFGYIFGASDYSDNEVYVPETLKEVIITGGASIAEHAFYGCSGIIQTENGVCYVDNWVIDCDESVTSVQLREGTRGIADFAFSGCSGLASVTIPDSVTSISNGAFYECSGLTSVTIPDSVTSIGSSAFRGCSGLTSVTIPDSVTSIGNYAFYECSGLESITIPFVGEKADGTGATNFGYIFGAWDYSDNKDYVPESLKEVVITGGESIGNREFYGCSGLTSVTIPDSVTSIGDYAFYNCSGLTDVYYQGNLSGWLRIEFGSSSANPMNYADNLHIADMPKDGVVVIEDGITAIRGYALKGLKELASVNIPSSVTSIGSGAFYGCSGLTSITIPFVGGRADGTGATHFGYIFGASHYSGNYGNVPSSLKEVIITGGANIGERAFEDCSGLISITIPDSVTSIGEYAFLDCGGLTDVYYQGDLSGWSEIDFYGYYANPMCYADNLYINGELLQGNVVIPEGTEKIGDYAFYNRSGLTSIVIPSSVTSIGEHVLSGCSGLESITIPFVGKRADGTGATNFGYIFGDLYNNDYVPESLKEVIITGGASIAEQAFSGCSGLTSVTIGGSVTSIGKFAFSGCSGLTSVTIGNGVTSIGGYAFSGCSGLTSITIPDSVTSIGNYAFTSCSGLTSITIPFVGERADGTGATNFGYIFGTLAYVPESLKEVIITGGTSIGEQAFSGRSGLTSITIGSGVTSIGEWAFLNCSGLTSVTIPDSVTSIDSSAFQGCTSLQFNEYGGAKYLGNEVNPYVVLYDVTDISVTSFEIMAQTKIIYGGAFSGCSGLTSITIPDSVTSIGNSAFSDCSGLTSVTIPDSVTSIGNSAFSDCSGLTSVTIGNCVTSIGEYAFYKCSGLTSVTIPDSVTSIGQSAFYGCNVIIQTENGVSYVDGWVFECDESVTSVQLREGTRGIADSAFYGCDGLKSVTIPDSVTSIGEDAFNGCSGLTSITIPDSVTSIGDGAFSRCSGLESITIPDSVTSIGEYAFSRCSGLESITIPDSVTSIGDYAFRGCSGLTAINFRGTKAQWQAIEKGSYWDEEAGSYTVHCTDGTIS